MRELIYPRERKLGTITLVLGILFWAVLVMGTLGIALLFLLAGYVLYLFTQSTLISYIKGNGVLLSQAQFPDLFAQFEECCSRLQLEQKPTVYVLSGDGGLNAFATRFLGASYVVLLSDVVDAMRRHEDGVRFYLGHELGHLKRKHLTSHFLRWPALWLPLLGAAYSRSMEYTCDLHGRACCNTPEGASRSLAALAAGSERWEQLHLPSYVGQVTATGGFWMSFHELIAGYPWLVKRVARISGLNVDAPKRNPFAYVFAVVVPFAGRLGAGLGLLIMVYVIGVLAAIAIPAYNTHMHKAEVAAAMQASEPVRAAVLDQFRKTGEFPTSLEDLKISPALAEGSTAELNQDGHILVVTTSQGALLYQLVMDTQHKVLTWACFTGDDLDARLVPPECDGESHSEYEALPGMNADGEDGTEDEPASEESSGEGNDSAPALHDPDGKGLTS